VAKVTCEAIGYFDRFLIMYNLCVFTCIIFIFCISLYTCANVICIKLLLTYLLTYLLKVEEKTGNDHAV